MADKVLIDKQVVKGAMFAIQKLQGHLGIDLTDADGYGETYFALEKALKEADAK